MKSTASLVQPPSVAIWLVNLFTLPKHAESILGDMHEEFLLLALKSEVDFARRWYWRQTLKTITQLAGVGVRTAPWLTAAAVVGGFFLRRLVGPLVEPAIFAVLERYHVFEHHFSIYMFFASTGIDIGHIITFLFIGFMVALAARGTEMVATMTLGLVYGAMAVAGSVYIVTKTGDYAFLWRLMWYFADSFAIVIGGAIVRTRRSAATILPSNA